MSVFFASQVTVSGLGFSHLQMEVMITRKVLLGFGAGTAVCAMWLLMERAREPPGKAIREYIQAQMAVEGWSHSF